MRKSLLIIFFQTILTGFLFSQPDVSDPRRNDFTGTMGLLSSDWMEGREAGMKGSFMAADYILSQMLQHGLKPGSGVGRSNHFFQDFDMLRYKTMKSAFIIIEETGKGQIRKSLIPEVDFATETGPADFHFEAPLVFAGYGIIYSQAGYNDYNKVDVSGCIVVIMDGFPGKKDTLSPGWKKFGSDAMNEFYSLETKQRNAAMNGALAMILVSPEENFFELRSKQGNKNIAGSVFSQIEMEQSGYEDDNYALQGDSVAIPLCRLRWDAAAGLMAGTGIDLKEAAERIAARLVPESAIVKGKKVIISAEMKAEPVSVRNILGHIQGVDTTKSIIIGAHYDHLGMRGNSIYNGSDDNASGVAGMLALAGVWMRSGIKPPCNIIFAAWTAEEKGLLGSSWFVRNFDFKRQRILLNVNFDMISRSDPEDHLARVISIGLLKGTDDLKAIAVAQNKLLKQPFELDLWETTGNGGSDYAPFAKRKIPVMSFFSGYQADYHTPRDLFSKADLVKMESILSLANQIIIGFFKK